MTDQKLPEDAAIEESAEAAPSSAPEEPPFIDDPVSKWWIGIIIAVFAVIFAFAIFFGSNGLLSGILDSEEATPSPEPTLTASPSPEASVEASTAPVGASIEPSSEPTAEPTA